MSFIPANVNNFETSFSADKFAPFGAGINFILTPPHLASIFNGIVCGVAHPHSHDPQPLLIFIMFNFAFLSAFSLAGIVSLAFPIPIHTYPFLFPITTKDENDGLFPSAVFFCVCLHMLLFPPPNLPLLCPTIIKSDSRLGIKQSTISGSKIFKPLSKISSILVISPFFTFLPSSVFGCHDSLSNSFANLTPIGTSSIFFGTSISMSPGIFRLQLFFSSLFRILISSNVRLLFFSHLAIFLLNGVRQFLHLQLP